LKESFKLEQSDLDRIQREIRKDEDFDMHAQALILLAEVLYSEKSSLEFNETIAIAEKLQSEVLAAGQLKAAGDILEALKGYKNSISPEIPQRHERINQAITFAGSHEKLSILAQVLNNNSEITSDEIRQYLGHFGWEALSPICNLLGILEFRPHRSAICDYLIEKGAEHVEIIAKGIFDKRWFVVRNTALILGQIGNDRAIDYLARAINHDEPRVRLEVVRGLGERITRKGVELIVQMVWDADNRVHRTALEAIMDLPDKTALFAISKVVGDERFAILMENDQEKLIMALSDLGGGSVVDYLVSLITDWRISKSQSRQFFQKVAFRALADNPSEEAEIAIKKLCRAWRKNLRAMAGEALKRRQHNIKRID